MILGQTLLEHLPDELLWSLLATAAMTTILEGSQGLGLSRLSPAFVVGTFFTASRSRAHAVGYLAYAFGGWLFAIVYVAGFISIGEANWWIGMLFGAAHSVVLLVAILPVIPYVHPRMASDYDGPSHAHRLEPPGFIGWNYGYRTPLAVLVAHCAFGAVLGLGTQLSHIA